MRGFVCNNVESLKVLSTGNLKRSSFLVSLYTKRTPTFAGIITIKSGCEQQEPDVMLTNQSRKVVQGLENVVIAV